MRGTSDPASATITQAATFTYTFTQTPSYTVTYKVEGGTWSDGSAADRTETVQSGSKPKSVPTGMKAASGYADGAWDKNPASVTITQATTFTYTFEAKADVTRKVTFRVAYGSWDDGTKEDKDVTLVGKKGDELRLAAGQIPAVGTKPGSGYRAGSWDVEPSATTAIEKDTTYTYTYAKKGAASVTKAPEARELTYNGRPQELVTPGEAVGGEMYYELGADAVNAPSGMGADTSVPTATEAGTYYVWYRVVGDAGHDDTEPRCVTVTIAQATPAPTPTPAPVPTPTPVPAPGAYSRPYHHYSGSSSSESSSDEPAEERAGMHRMFNPATGEHFYTASDAERDDLRGKGWSYEGIAFYVPKRSNTPVWRLFNPKTGEHLYTTDAAERQSLLAAGWNDEGTAWYADDAQGKAMYRLFDPKAAPVASHHFTSSEAERQELLAAGWTDQGLGFYACE